MHTHKSQLNIRYIYFNTRVRFFKNLKTKIEILNLKDYGSGFFGSFDAPWSERSWIDLFIKETQNLFSDSLRFKNPILDFLKETHPENLTSFIVFLHD